MPSLAVLRNRRTATAVSWDAQLDPEMQRG